jgi:hypothetical protein
MSDQCTHTDAIRDVTPSARLAVRSVCKSVHHGYICGSAGPVAMSAAATTRRTGTPRSISTRRTILPQK